MPGTAPLARQLPRDLHPVAWWVWAIGLATAASLTTNPLLLLLVMGSATVVVMARRSGHPFGRSFRLYAALAAVTVVLRVVFRILFGGQEVGHVLLELPEVPLPDWAAGVRLLGPITSEALLAGLYDGLRLAAVILCVGAANSLANPKRLLASLPPALYEVGTALVVAVTIFPQLADSARRVRAAQALRGGTTKGVGRLRRFLVPVLEDALERSLALAAGMDTRGYGRSGGATVRERWVTGGLLLLALTGICVGTYAWLDPTAPQVLALPVLGTGVVVAVVGLVSAGRRVQRTRYRPDLWRAGEAVAVGTGLVVAVLGWYVGHTQVVVAYPGVDVAPYLSPLALLVGVLGTVPAVATPVPASALPQRDSSPREVVA
ncbi:energy-coupling factor transporter transmembrane protein EcfT [Nocardioides oleivorans]|uniref:Energy-coupling factor transporter transmembrane protein EcfT n=1 Tax=Nocardioides oleivorans TaxID=273676 RepID=A0A4V1RLC3_9ACTN|nr:energy-coupling factor transporter transmembrane component T [Nocardioides oleivorans]RYB95282.1 energy-coupling factor transporter transmembrane protein EcfT [Nocardioides oleivorans]